LTNTTPAFGHPSSAEEGISYFFHALFCSAYLMLNDAAEVAADSAK